MKLRYLFIMIIGCALFLSLGVQTAHSGDQSTILMPTQNETTAPLQTAYGTHIPIYIDDNGDFPDQGFTGEGNKEKPWILENLFFQGVPYPDIHLIHIQDTTDFFIIRNCYFDGVLIDWDCINLLNVRNGVIKNNTIIYGSHGIALQFSDNNRISGNNISFSDVGLLLSSSNENRIDRNNVSDSEAFGIEINTGSSDNVVINNNVSQNDAGIVLWGGARNNQIVTNDVFSNQYEAIGLHSTDHINISDNHVFENGGGIAYESSHFINVTWNVIHDNGAEGVGLNYDDTNSLVAHNTIYKNYWGILITDYSDHNVIRDNICRDNYQGIYVENSDSNIIVGNECFSNDFEGIVVVYDSTGNRVTGNNCHDNLFNGIGIGLGATNNIIEHNHAYNNGNAGINLWAGYVNTVTQNNCYENEYGISMRGGSSGNTILENLIAFNEVGIYLLGGSSNTIFHNSIIDNTVQAIDQAPVSPNFWYDPNLQEGNYWSDYIGVDLNGDGIGDTDVPWPDIGYDLYPLVPSAMDADGDGLSDDAELIIGTNPNSPDSDSDGFNDDDEWRLYFTDPLTSTSPQEAAESIYSRLQDLVNSGHLTGNDAWPLKRKVDAAIALMNRGHWVGAVQKLSDFIKQVNAKVSSGALSREDGDTLIAMAQGIINVIRAMQP